MKWQLGFQFLHLVVPPLLYAAICIAFFVIAVTPGVLWRKIHSHEPKYRFEYRFRTHSLRHAEMQNHENLATRLPNEYDNVCPYCAEAIQWHWNLASGPKICQHCNKLLVHCPNCLMPVWNQAIVCVHCNRDIFLN